MKRLFALLLSLLLVLASCSEAAPQEKVLGRKAVTERILSAVPSLVEVAADGNTFLKIRKDIGDELDRTL